jgi:phospholipase/lecithinase/hemolysin
LLNVTASSQGAPVNPDLFLFWDDIHPTTHGHNIVAMSAAAALARSNCDKKIRVFGISIDVCGLL